jgi:hypothetical protein
MLYLIPAEDLHEFEKLDRPNGLHIEHRVKPKKRRRR